MRKHVDTVLARVRGWLMVAWGVLPWRARGFLSSFWVRTALSGFAAFVVFYVAVDWIAMPLATRHGSERVVPDVIGLAPDSARLVLDQAGMELAVSREDYSPDVDAGRVMSCEPVVGARVKSGRVVKVVLSLGSSVVAMPDLTGVKLDQAQDVLRNLRLIPGAVEYVVQDSIPPDIVVSTKPAAGESVEMGQTVSFVVTRGKAENIVIVPNLIGLTLPEARRSARDFGFTIGVVTEVRDNRYIPGTIIDQSILEGTQAFEGVVIDLTVSASE